MEFEYMERIQKVESKIMVFCDDQERRINKVTRIFENIKQAESENASELVEIKTKTYRELESLAEKIDL
jgi:archaellum component FlaC